MIVVIGLYAVWVLRRSLRSVGMLCLGGCRRSLGLFAYNYACFGNPLDSGYSHDWCWSAAQAGGLQGFTYPHLIPLWDLTFGTSQRLFRVSLANSTWGWRRWCSAAGAGVKLVNEYGPTETVVGCSIYRIEEGAPRHGGMPIGKPISNMTMYVLDGEWKPLPMGVQGELYIGG